LAEPCHSQLYDYLVVRLIRITVLLESDPDRVAAIRGSLEQEAFAAAWARGKAMTIDEAVAYAR
jgi:hypothetical protein